MRYLTSLFFAFVLFSSAVHAADAQAPRTEYEKKCQALIAAKGRKFEGARLREMFEFQWKYLMTTYPEYATWVGYPGQNDRWTDRSLAAYALRSRELKCPVAMMKSIAVAKLSAKDRVDYELFLERAEEELLGVRFPREVLQITQLDGVHQEIAQLFTVMPRAREQDYRIILARLRGAGQLLDQSLILLRKGLESKVTPPKITLRAVPAQVEAMITEDPLTSPLLSPFTEMPADLSADVVKSLRAEAAAIFDKELRPRLKELKRFLVEEYLPGARESIAWRDLPDGEAWYAYRARNATTTNLTPREIHDIGLREVERIRGEMQKIVTEVSFKGSLAEFFQYLRTDAKFFYSSVDELLRGYRDIGKRADPELIRLFGRLPRLPYGVKPIPAYSEKSAPTAYYEGGSTKTGRAGYFLANTFDLRSRPKWEMEALSLHEAVPGHHLQIALAEEMDAGPEFRKYGEYNAYVEGWGLYAESLGYEMGFYRDPYSRFGQLTYEMWRAMRLVVDTGMHHLGWSRQKAIDFMLANSPKTEHDVTAEVDRYIVWAGQALSYKIGQLKIKELRERATRELATRFDIRRFHDMVLGQGAVPLKVLERMTVDWIAAEKQKGEKVPHEKKQI